MNLLKFTTYTYTNSWPLAREVALAQLFAKFNTTFTPLQPFQEYLWLVFGILFITAVDFHFNVSSVYMSFNSRE